MISYNLSEELLGKYISDKKIIVHSKGVAEFAHQLAEKISKNHPELKINPEKVKIAALLHDIGKYKEEGHEERSLQILKNEGLEEIAKISRHGFLYKPHLESQEKNTSKQIENKIVVYSDFRFKYSPMTIEERLEEAKTGWKRNPKTIEKRVKTIKTLLKTLENELFELAGERM